jgi:hypothetical protein
MPSRIEVARQEYKGKSLFDLYVAKQQTDPDSEDHRVIVALIEMRKDRRDRWTLIAAIVAAVAAIAGLFWHC